MKKRFIIIFCLLFSLVALNAKEKSDKVLVFISNLYSGKISYSSDNFVKQGFIATSTHGTGYETLWNNQIVEIFVMPEEKNAQFFFSQSSFNSIDVSQPYNTKKEAEPDRQKYLSDWQSFIEYFLDHYKLISSYDNIYRFKNFKIVNNPDDYSFFIMNYALDE